MPSSLCLDSAAVDGQPGNLCKGPSPAVANLGRELKWALRFSTLRVPWARGRPVWHLLGGTAHTPPGVNQTDSWRPLPGASGLYLQAFILPTFRRGSG